jgi:hypothetical protein
MSKNFENVKGTVVGIRLFGDFAGRLADRAEHLGVSPGAYGRIILEDELDRKGRKARKAERVRKGQKR